MPPFPKPTVDYAYDLAVERRRLRAHRKARAMPRKGPGRLLVGSWNIANFGLQERRNDDLALIAELLSWFDGLSRPSFQPRRAQRAGRKRAEGWWRCRENPSTALRTCFADLYQVVHLMGTKYQVLMSDAGGNNERLVFIYDRRKLRLLDEISEVSIAPSRAKSVKLEPEGAPFVGFDRPPYLASFNLAGTPLSVQLVNVHLFFGSPGPARACPERSEGSRDGPSSLAPSGARGPEVVSRDPSPFGLGTSHAQGAARRRQCGVRRADEPRAGDAGAFDGGRIEHRVGQPV